MTPDFKITLDGQDKTEIIRPYLSSIEVRDQDGTELDTAEITLSHDSRIAIPSRGTNIEIFLGYKNDSLFSVFKGIINKIGVNGPPERLFLHATGLGLSDEKRLQNSTTRAWNQQKLSTIFSEVVGSAGFKARVHSSFSEIQIKRMLQSLETDIEFLQKIADLFAGFLKSDGEIIALLPNKSRESASGKALPKLIVENKKTDFSEYGWTQDYRRFSGSIIAFYQNDGETLFIKRGRGTPERKIKQIYSSKSEAEAAADREISRQETQTELSITMPGQSVAVGGLLEVRGFPVPVSNEYWIRSVNHSFSDKYIVRVESEK